MTVADRWLLPDGVEELLPDRAAQAEALRRRLLDLFASWGYELVYPPLLEFTDSLLVGLGDDIDLQTFRVTDQLTGRMMGLRADITPQVARIDAHSLRREGPTRLCYAGSVLHTRAKTPFASRSPIQIGAEFYGDGGLASDTEVVLLMLETLGAAGLDGITLDLGHVGIYSALVDAAALDVRAQRQLFDALQRKADVEIDAILDRVDGEAGAMLRALGALHGGADTLERARQRLANGPAPVGAALDELAAVAKTVAERLPGVKLYFDLAELRGYHYHTGLVFGALVPGCGQAVANGGRYDRIGEVFGRARFATGFNTDLKLLISLLSAPQAQRLAVFAPASSETGWWQAVQDLREGGDTVICGLPGEESHPRCNRVLSNADGEWRVEQLTDGKRVR